MNPNIPKDANQLVWAPDLISGFVLGRVVDIQLNTATVSLIPASSNSTLNSGSKTVKVPYENLYPAEENPKDVDDNCALMYLNEATLLNNVYMRYKKDQIYTYVANILIALNPYFTIDELYSSKAIKLYNDRSLGTLPPHVFAVADKAYRDMKRSKESQSIIVSGESGAGKTESQKYVLRYLCENWGCHAGPIEQRILETNPILEAFGNAKTLRNNNSSRFGKFIELHFDSKNLVVGGYVSHYLLEKSRIVGQQLEERNYHIFYILCAGSPSQMRQEFKLNSPDNFNYLQRGCTQYFVSPTSEKCLKPDQLSRMHKGRGALRDPLIDDVEDFRRLDIALGNIGLTQAAKFDVYSVVAAVLHLGNVNFIEAQNDSRGGSIVDEASRPSLEMASSLLGVDHLELASSLISRVMHANKGSGMATIIKVPLKSSEAKSARDALAKSIYSRLFDFIVKTINKSIPFDSSRYYIGVLDIAGFEYFTINSFEQFCINYCNEKLQQFFNTRILKQEQELYEKEGLAVKKITFIDNVDCLELIEAKKIGIFDLLDEESKLPKPNPQHFTSSLHQIHKDHFRLSTPRKSKLKEHREIRDDEGFLVRHFAGAVCYYTTKFIEKNNDALHSSLEYLLVDSKSQFLRQLYAEETNSQENFGDEKGPYKSSSISSKKGRLIIESVGSKFRSQLKLLIEKLQITGTHFIRCVKPNNKMVAHDFDGGSVLSQLQCSGLTSVLALMHQGFPSRTQFSELYNMYQNVLPDDLRRLDPRLFCKCLFKALGLNDCDFKFGLTKVFFRSGKFAEFDQLLRSDPENLKTLVSKVRLWLIRTRWKKLQWCALSVIKLKNKILYRREHLIRIQSLIRRHLVKKKYKSRIEGVKKIAKSCQIFVEMRSVASKLKRQKEESLNEIEQMEKLAKNLILKLKDPTFPIEKISAECDDFLNRVLSRISDLKTLVQLQTDEQSCLNQLQNQIELEQKKKVEKEKIEKLAQEKHQQLPELENKQKAEIEARQTEKGGNSFYLEKLNEEVISIEIKRQREEEIRRYQLREQERRDREIALRLALELNRNVDDITDAAAVVTPQYNKPTAHGRVDLSNLKFPELRDIINTSNDIALLEACRDEFHRRLNVYHQWKKSVTLKDGEIESYERAPEAIIKNADLYNLAVNSLQNNRKKDESSVNKNNVQRYFRVPFTRKSDQYRDGQAPKTGWWLAHFDGQWVARQIEIHPDKPPVLLLAGKDDMQMCELSLDQTGLLHKKGAEISSAEFEHEWDKAGGQAYKRGPV